MGHNYPITNNNHFYSILFTIANINSTKFVDRPLVFRGQWAIGEK